MNSKPELNDQFGLIESWSEKNQRWKVRLEIITDPEKGKGTLLELREKNIELVDL